MSAGFVATIAIWASVGTISAFLIAFSVSLILSSFFCLFLSCLPLVLRKMSSTPEKSMTNLPCFLGMAEVEVVVVDSYC